MMNVKITKEFLKEVELIKKASEIKTIYWLISPHDYGYTTSFDISLTEVKRFWEDEFLFDFGDYKREIKDRQERFTAELEKNYLCEAYPDRVVDDEEEEDDDEEYPIPPEKKREFFEAAEYNYYIEVARLLAKRIQNYLEKPEDEKIYISCHGKLLVAYDDAERKEPQTEWEKEYRHLTQRFEILKVKLNIPEHRTIDTYDALTEEDLKVLNKLRYWHEINRTVLLGKYYVLLSNIVGFFADSKGKLKDGVTFEEINSKKYLTLIENGQKVRTIAWDDEPVNKIYECWGEEEMNTLE